MNIAVVSTAIPSRIHNYLPVMLQSVTSQTLQPIMHTVVIDYEQQGIPARTLNRGLRSIPPGIEWVIVMADDDYFHPTLLEEYALLIEDADVIWSVPTVINDAGEEVPDAFNAQSMQPPGIFGGGTMIRHALLADGYPLQVQEDRAMFAHLLEQGARFVQAPSGLWTYRMHRGSISQRGYANGSR